MKRLYEGKITDMADKLADYKMLITIYENGPFLMIKDVSVMLFNRPFGLPNQIFNHDIYKSFESIFEVEIFLKDFLSCGDYLTHFRV